jgi:isoquinoline 1-oxidoreductase beta subunit
VPAGEITVAAGTIKHEKSKKSAAFGQFAAAAAKLPVPTEVTLKDPKDFKLIGRELPRVDTAAKSNGTAQFAMDVRLPGMLTAVVARPPLFGATVKSFDQGKARAVPGVRHVVQIPTGVAVVAENTWAAIKGREALTVEWDDSKAEKRGTKELMEEYRKLADQAGPVAAKRGDIGAALAGATKTFEAHFDFPYLAHAPMEPLDCVVRLTPTSCEIWAGDQFQTVDQMNAAAALGLKPQQVKINTVFAGGSFGRRATVTSDYVAEGVQIAKAIRGVAPVRLVWTREDDIKGGRYRPLTHHWLKAAVGADGMPAAWQHRIVTQSIMTGTMMEPMMVKNGIDGTSVEGATNLPYAIPNLQVELHTTKVGVPILWWRSVGHTHTAFTVETFIDELLALAGKDPVEGRLALLGGHPRHAGVLRAVAEFADWGASVAEGRARGVAVHKSFDTYVAQVAEVSAERDGGLRVHKVWCAVDCGVPVNPNVITAQMEGGIGYGLGAVLYNEITLLDGGEVAQSNFHDYRALRIHEMPEVAVRVIPSTEKPTGVGEPGVPPVGPAVANAWRALTGEAVRRLPFRAAAGV